MSLRESLKENWPVHRVTASCEICDVMFFDTMKKQPTMWKASYIASLIETFARKHESESGHASIDVNIYTNPSPTKEIDATVTVK